MYVSIVFPVGVSCYTDKWFLDGDALGAWSVGDLLADILWTAQLPASGWKLQLGGLDLTEGDMVADVLTSEDTLSLVEA